METDDIDDTSDPSDFGEPGSEYRLFIQQQSQTFPILLTEVESNYVHVFTYRNRRMSITFQYGPDGSIVAWVRGFVDDTFVDPKVEDLDGTATVVI